MAQSVSRRRWLGAAAGALAVANLPHARAQEKYPSKNIRVVVPTAQGGSADRGPALLADGAFQWRKQSLRAGRARRLEEGGEEGVGDSA